MKQKDKPKTYLVTRKPRKCLRCGGKVVPILYGEPNEESGILIRAGEMIMGGCLILEENPQWGCIECEVEYLKLKKSDNLE